MTKHKRPKSNARSEGFAKSLRELGALFEVSHDTIRVWLRKGAPAASASGFYPISEWKEWVAAHGSREDVQPVTSDKATLIARQVHLKNQKLELEIQQKKGELIHRDDVRTKLFQTFDTCRRLQLKIGSTLAGRIGGMTPAQIKSEIDAEIANSYIEIRRWADEQAVTETDETKAE
jgi:hypothetical protein